MSAIETIIEARVRALDADFEVGRVLPAPARRMIGPFAFLDHMGPVTMPVGRGLDVRPHPHLRLATVTYLFEGAFHHRDSLGSSQRIEPGAINWMTAGRGIVHSERSPEDERTRGVRAHGLQLWVALPAEQEDVEPSFSHHPAPSLPEIEERGARIRVLAGSALGVASPVPVLSPLVYLDVKLERGARFEVPADHDERGVYVVSGEASCDGTAIAARTMAVLRSGARPSLEAIAETRLVVIGGASIGPRYIWWNFVSSSKERIEEAAREWREGRFPKVPGDEIEFIPITEEPRFPRS